MKIAISGHSGCGNTTATKNVGSELNLQVVNYTFRDLAKHLNIDFHTLHSDAPNNAIYDYLTDFMLIRQSLSGNVIVGSRLAAWILEADLRIWLHAPLESRAQRISKRETEKSYEAVLYQTLKRDEQNVQRYMKLYGIDLDDHSDFDIIINTHQLNVEQVSSLITAAARWASANQQGRSHSHAQRIKAIIQKKLNLPQEAFEDIRHEVNPVEIFKRVKRVDIY